MWTLLAICIVLIVYQAICFIPRDMCRAFLENDSLGNIIFSLLGCFVHLIFAAITATIIVHGIAK